MTVNWFATLRWARLRSLRNGVTRGGARTSHLAVADPERRRRVFDAFRLAIDRNAGQIRVKALISSAFTKTRDLQKPGR
jgi:hypothetical protein